MLSARPLFRAVASAVAPRQLPSAARSYHAKDMLPPPPAASYRRAIQATIGKILTLAALIDHYSNPRNVGSLDRNDTSVGTAIVGAPACGDVIKLGIRVDEQTGRIVESKFKTFGCGSAIASSSYLTTLVNGMLLDDAAKIKNVDISKELCLPPVKLHCSLLAEDAIKSAIADYRSKRATNLASAPASTLADVSPKTDARKDLD